MGSVRKLTNSSEERNKNVFWRSIVAALCLFLLISIGFNLWQNIRNSQLEEEFRSYDHLSFSQFQNPTDNDTIYCVSIGDYVIFASFNASETLQFAVDIMHSDPLFSGRLIYPELNVTGKVGR